MRSSRDDLLEDAEALHFLVASAMKRLDAYLKALASNTDSFENGAVALLKASAEQLRSDFSELDTKIAQMKKALRNESLQDLRDIRDTKKTCASLIRILYSRLGSTLAEGNWQSPSFDSALVSEAGSETGIIHPSQDDYKRDAYAAERNYTQRFVSEYIDHTFPQRVAACTTTNGMSAFSTAVDALYDNPPAAFSVLAGVESYFQNKWVLEKKFGSTVRYANELDADNFLQQAVEVQPHLVCLDSFSSAKGAIPDISKILRTLPQVIRHPFSVILDNTVLSTSYQPLHDVPLLSRMRLYVVESLLKYHQFGLDRVNAGIIWSLSEHATLLSTARMHLGAILPEASLYALPEPSRTIFDARLNRIGANAELLARRLNEFVEKNTTIVDSVVHPSLGDDDTNSRRIFHGPFVILRFKDVQDSVKNYDRFVARAISEARKKDVALVGGTSFGFDVTRIYVAARLAEGLSRPYLRISVGTETLEELSALGDVFEQALM